MRPELKGAAIFAAVGLAVSAAQAGPVYGFYRITGNSSTDVAAQLSVEILDTGEHAGVGAGQVGFRFANAGPLASSITDVYFEDGTLLGISSIINGPGVDFAQGASPPDLPGGNAVGFNTTAGFSADSTPPTQPNGVNPGEWVIIVFNLINGQNFADTIAALNATPPGLRIGIHVQGLPDGESDSFVNIIPLPSAVGMGAVGMLLVARRRRRETL